MSKSVMDLTELFSEGLRHHVEGRVDTAENIYREVLRRNPRHADALHHLGLVHLQLGAVSEAIEEIQSSLESEPRNSSALANLGYCLNLIGDHTGASAACNAALEVDPTSDGAWTNLGNAQRALKSLAEAIRCYEKALTLCPSNPNYIYNAGLALFDQGEFDRAKGYFQRCLANDPSIPEAHNSLAACFLKLHDPRNALHHATFAVQLRPGFPEALRNQEVALSDLELRKARTSLEASVGTGSENAETWVVRGIELYHSKHYEEALANYDRAILVQPRYAEAWFNKGLALSALQNYQEALASYDRAMHIEPEHADIWISRGMLLGNLRRHEEALASLDRAIALKPDYAEAWSSRGGALGNLRRYEEALASLDRAIALKPDFAEAWGNRGVALNDLQRHEEALVSYERAIELKPDADYVLGDLVDTQTKICDWTDLGMRCRTLESRLLSGDPASSPFAVLGLFDDPHLQKRCAEIYERRKFSFGSELGPVSKRSKKDKIRIGYFSMDFREHPVAHLVAELIETHDRKMFEIYGFSFGESTVDSMRKRLEMAFDKFLEVRHLSELSIARLARDHEIDIAIDLGGYTRDSRPAIFTHRAAPIQINYLGFPGTMGSSAIDYLIADPVLIPEGLQSAYSEKIIYLPNSYQVNDSQRAVSDRVFAREELGLPKSGFVFCCFNNNWKIRPETFNMWLGIIQSVPNSVLWLYEDNPTAARNLRAGAEKRHIDPLRLVFAKHMPHAEHLARYRLADLFLDTFPYGAHTTASDALWVGLPVLTRSGQSFASRVAGSLLHSVGLPELITHTTEEYESLAIELANNSEKVVSLKARLAGNRATCPLFNTPLFTQHIESAYRAAYDRYHEGLALSHIEVVPK